MRAKNFADWLLEGLLLLIFCGIITGLHYIANLDYGELAVTLWAVAGVWIAFGVARYIHYRLKDWRGRR